MPSYKIIVAGARNVGKSEIVRQYVNLSFCPQYNPTDSFLSYNKIVNVNQGKETEPLLVRLNVIDTYLSQLGKA